MPIASTRPNSDRLLSEKPSIAMTANVPISDTGTATIGNDRRPPVLQEHQHDDEDEDERFDQRVNDAGDRLVDEHRRVVVDAIVDAFGKAALELLHLGADGLGRVERVGAGQLEDGQRDRWLAVEVAVDVVVLRAELDAFVDDAPIGIARRLANNVLEMDDAAVVARLEDDVFELLFGRQPAGRVDRQLKLDRVAAWAPAAGRAGRRRPAGSARGRR